MAMLYGAARRYLVCRLIHEVPELPWQFEDSRDEPQPFPQRRDKSDAPGMVKPARRATFSLNLADIFRLGSAQDLLA